MNSFSKDEETELNLKLLNKLNDCPKIPLNGSEQYEK